MELQEQRGLESFNAPGLSVNAFWSNVMLLPVILILLCFLFSTVMKFELFLTNCQNQRFPWFWQFSPVTGATGNKTRM